MFGRESFGQIAFGSVPDAAVVASSGLLLRRRRAMLLEVALFVLAYIAGGFA